MGQCGCSDFNPVGKIPGPNDDCYVLQIYPGCQQCNAAAGVIIYQMTEKELNDDWGEVDLPKLRISPNGLGIPVLHFNSVAKEMVDSLADWVADLQDFNFRQAVHKTAINWVDGMKKQAR